MLTLGITLDITSNIYLSILFKYRIYMNKQKFVISLIFLFILGSIITVFFYVNTKPKEEAEYDEEVCRLNKTTGKWIYKGGATEPVWIDLKSNNTFKMNGWGEDGNKVVGEWEEKTEGIKLKFIDPNDVWLEILDDETLIEKYGDGDFKSVLSYSKEEQSITFFLGYSDLASESEICKDDHFFINIFNNLYYLEI